jgi:acyl carrier protein
MKKDIFLKELKEILEIEETDLSLNTPINLTSIATLTVMVFIDENFNKQVNAMELKKVSSPEDLLGIIGLENFDD